MTKTNIRIEYGGNSWTVNLSLNDAGVALVSDINGDVSDDGLDNLTHGVRVYCAGLGRTVNSVLLKA